MPEYEVTIHDMTLRRYVIEADSEEDAQEIAESDDLPPPWASKIIDSEWYVESVKFLSEETEEVSEERRRELLVALGSDPSFFINEEKEVE
jgi:hypothetical protein